MGPGSTGRPQDGAGSRGRRAARLRRNQPEPRRTPPRTWPDRRRTLVDGGTWVLDFGGLQPELDRPPSGPAQPHRWCRTQPGSRTQQDARRTLAGLRGNSPELAGRCHRTFPGPDSGRTRAGTGAGLCRTSKDAPYCRGSSTRGYPSSLVCLLSLLGNIGDNVTDMSIASSAALAAPRAARLGRSRDWVLS